MGKARSKQQSLRDGAFNDDKAKEFGSDVMNVILHGDAALPGQGINQECLMMGYSPNFDVGGTIHVVINNHVGYTTPAERGRSSRYATDIAKSINSPVVHVNSDDPEQVALVTKFAFDYQRKFRKDIFIDMNCFRRLGHNELDDPTMTNPQMYRAIRSIKLVSMPRKTFLLFFSPIKLIKLPSNFRSVPDVYAEKMVNEGILTKEDVEKITKDQFEYFNKEFMSAESYVPEKSYFDKQWQGFVQASKDLTIWDTGVDWNILNYVGKSSVYHPKDFVSIKNFNYIKQHCILMM